MDKPIIISHYQAKLLLASRKNYGMQMTISTDLEISTSEVTIIPNGVIFSNEELVSWKAIEKISANENNCFVIGGGKIRKIVAFSENTNRVYSLMPTRTSPTMIISGFTMHRIKNCDPYLDTIKKIDAIKPIKGHILDTTTGLGYTAIEASKSADLVTTIEIDPTSLEIARHNPWSSSLFDNKKITQLLGDSFKLVESFPGSTFTRIIHDPPTFNQAGHLYSEEFYKKLFRILKNKGKLFHYIGNPNKKSAKNFYSGVIDRLYRAGFSRVSHNSRAFGVVAKK